MTRTIQIREVPEDVHAVLRARAAAVGESLSGYLLEELVRVASRPSVADVLRRAGQHAVNVSHEDVLAAIDEGRERRSA